MPSPLEDARDVRDQLKAWLLRDAYPLWAEVGCDLAGGFFEKIDQAGAPVQAPRRVRVAARHIYAYSVAGKLGWTGDWRAVVEHGLAALERYRRPDGLYGVLMSPDGALLDDTPHPYEQAFAMLALASAQMALGRHLEPEAVGVREALREQLGRADGGFHEPGADEPLGANPHMHLFEAAQTWAAVGADSGWTTMSKAIAALALTRMIDGPTGALCELFDADWNPLAEADVEPGHQFEWGWLLLQFGARDEALRLIDLAEKRGVDQKRGVAFNSLGADLQRRDLTARLWPQTERLKAGVAAALVTREERYWMLAANAGRGLQKYLVTDTPGLWLDRMSADGSLVDEAAPASSFYHIVGAVLDLDRALG